jgi:nitroimidazol reductase NimA-like FMN-containing flavoprotein (pyridoxamine 5'-phosphate oxidase superfamily)
LTDALDIDTFLAEPLVARLATNGPTVRPVWYQWEERSFWIMSGPWTRLFTRVQTDPQVALVIDVCELDTGRIRQVMAHGAVTIVPYDIPRARRMLIRYLGPDEESWSREPSDYVSYVTEPTPEGITWLKLEPSKLLTFDFSYAAAPLQRH